MIRELLDILMGNADIHVSEHISDDAESFSGVRLELKFLF